MIEKLIIALSSITVGFICISGINAVSSEVNEKSDYVSLSEQAYIKENDTFFAENLPYYQKETTEEELVTVFVDSNNSIIYELKH